jgi:uracil-DNA glycosylase family 4
MSGGASWRHAVPAEGIAPPALAALVEVVQGCRRCQAAGHLARAEPRLLGLAVLAGRPRTVVIGQAPSRHAGRYAEPLASPFVRVIAGWLAQAGFPTGDLFARVHFTALTRCFPGPGTGGRGDRPPSRAEIDLCAGHLAAELALLRPAVVLPVGKLAIDTLFGRPRPLADAVGACWERDGVRYLPLPHPSGVSRWRNEPANRARLDRALALLAAWRAELAL